MITSDMIWNTGFCKAPNNIHSLPGDEWYARGPGTPTVKYGEEIRLVDGQLQIWTTKYYQRPDNTFLFPISGIIAQFDTIQEMISYCQSNGRVSEPGLPAGYWGWD